MAELSSTDTDASPAPPAEAEALGWLFSLADQERGIGWNPAASPDEQWKLGRVRALLDLVGAPDRRMRCVLVAGTKGKGSTAVLLASILHAAGQKVGLATKPHLQTYRERVRVNGQAISASKFARAIGAFKGHVARLADLVPDAGEPTTFEVLTALALDHFARQQCDLAVIEVGMGGRLDATNAIDPSVSIITSLSYDHTAILGRTLAAIASEKAGIMRAGCPTLLAQQRPTALASLRRACGKVGADCRVVPPLERAPGSAEAEGLVLLPSRGGLPAYPVPLPLIGEPQRQNAALAVAAATALLRDVDQATLARGLARVQWPGRFEVVPGRPTVVLDGAHNGASAEALAATLGAFAGDRPIHLVLGLYRDKDARAMLRHLLPLATSVTATSPERAARALPAELLAQLCRRLTGVPIRLAPTVAEALKDSPTSSGRELVCVTGSLALVGAARDALGLPGADRLWGAGPGETSTTPPARGRLAGW